MIDELDERQFNELFSKFIAGSASESDLKRLEPYKVDNAVIMAAGKSTRFAPLSFEKPKGLLEVKGEILAERQIRQLKEAGINDITLVVGYMKEMFFYLADKYNVKIVVNEDYCLYNNPSSLIRVASRLKNTYICSSDNYFSENVFEPYVWKSYYSAVYASGNTEEYCLEFDKEGRITSVSIGGHDSWYMLGHVYWDRSFSRAFSSLLERTYGEAKTKDELWEKLYLRHIAELPPLHIRKYGSEVIHEFDSLEELRSFDPHYINNTNSRILANICEVLKCEEKDVVDINAIKQGLTNTSFSFSVSGSKYVYRHPGVGTDEYIDRRSEYFSMEYARKLKLDDTFIYMDRKEGWKISHFISNAHTLDYHNDKEVVTALGMIRKLHDADIKSKYDFDIWKKTLEFVDKIHDKGRDDFADFNDLLDKMTKLYVFTEKDGVPKRLCHCDCCNPNFLVDEEGKMSLIDWECSGNDDPASDLGTFICCSDYSYEKALKVLAVYFGREPDSSELRHFLAYVSIASYYWYVWAIYQTSVGKDVGEYLYIWYKRAKFYCQKAIEIYNIQ